MGFERTFKWSRFDPSNIPFEKVDPSRISWTDLDPSDEVLSAGRWFDKQVIRPAALDIKIQSPLPHIREALSDVSPELNNALKDLEQSTRVVVDPILDRLEDVPVRKNPMRPPSTGKVVVFDFTSEATIAFNLETQAYAVDLELISGLTVDDETLAKGAPPKVEPLELALSAIDGIYRIRRSNNYESLK
jgi:hypothetical protein